MKEMKMYNVVIDTEDEITEKEEKELYTAIKEILRKDNKERTVIMLLTTGNYKKKKNKRG